MPFDVSANVETLKCLKGVVVAYFMVTRYRFVNIPIYFVRINFRGFDENHSFKDFM